MEFSWTTIEAVAGELQKTRFNSLWVTNQLLVLGQFHELLVTTTENGKLTFTLDSISRDFTVPNGWSKLRMILAKVAKSYDSERFEETKPNPYGFTGDFSRRNPPMRVVTKNTEDQFPLLILRPIQPDEFRIRPRPNKGRQATASPSPAT
jgi:hypothetical protein